MSLFSQGAELIGDLGFRVIKNSGKVLYGAGQSIVGIVSEDEELIANGVKNLGDGAVGLSIGLVAKAIKGDSSDDDSDDNDLDV
ncbi:hypothetical protein VB711_25975 [Cronbergia sp. UHCC 0137]|jgi:hypothetical protein|uniref:hypothetical protein n=1 Tax=Cronbergia sp. UHCC 0137 TaxID=3110239 RepID=UPI002B2128E9|nr:hypothetical protein [Cronbergia sp. UHCC 0137]MEA5621256.1 hypothetical protein [Cronbergia sp. UHCC 0137]